MKNYRIVYKVLDRNYPDYGKDRTETHHAQTSEHVEQTIEDFKKVLTTLKLKFIDEYPLGGLYREGHTRVYDYREI
jgi:hypothetical protein